MREVSALLLRTTRIDLLIWVDQRLVKILAIGYQRFAINHDLRGFKSHSRKMFIYFDHQMGKPTLGENWVAISYHRLTMTNYDRPL